MRNLDQCVAAAKEVLALPRPQSNQERASFLDRICEIQRDYRITKRLCQVLGTAVKSWEEVQETQKRLCHLGRELLSQQHNQTA